MNRASGRLLVLQGHLTCEGCSGQLEPFSDASAPVKQRCRAAAAGTSQHPTLQGPVVLVGGMVMDLQAHPSGPADVQRGGSVPGRVTQLSGGVARNVAEALTLLLKTAAQSGKTASGGLGPAPSSISNTAPQPANALALPLPLLVSAVGDDLAGVALLQHWESLGLSTALITQLPGGATPTVAVVFDLGGEVAACVADVALLEQQLAPPLLRAPAVAAAIAAAPVVMLDGNLSPAALEEACTQAAAAGVPVWFEPVSVPKSTRAAGLLSLLSFVSPNEKELAAMAAAVRQQQRQQHNLSPPVLQQQQRQQQQQLSPSLSPLQPQQEQKARGDCCCTKLQQQQEAGGKCGCTTRQQQQQETGGKSVCTKQQQQPQEAGGHCGCTGAGESSCSPICRCSCCSGCVCGCEESQCACSCGCQGSRCCCGATGGCRSSRCGAGGTGERKYSCGCGGGGSGERNNIRCCGFGCSERTPEPAGTRAGSTRGAAAAATQLAAAHTDAASPSSAAAPAPGGGGAAGTTTPAAAAAGQEALLRHMLPDIGTVLQAGVRHVVLTLGADGAALCTLTPDGHAVSVCHMPALPATVISCSGAGDCLVAGCLYALARGQAAESALAHGIAASRSAVESQFNVPQGLNAADVGAGAAQLLRQSTQLQFALPAA